jgi:hypothetical protein
MSRSNFSAKKMSNYGGSPDRDTIDPRIFD